MSKDVWPGMGERIERRIRELGYPSIEKFTQAHALSGYSLGLVYKWIRGQVAPSRASILRLATDLGCDPAWLVFGRGPLPPKPTRRRPVPISGGAGASQPLPDGPPVNELPLIGRWLRRLVPTLHPPTWRFA